MLNSLNTAIASILLNYDALTAILKEVEKGCDELCCKSSWNTNSVEDV